VTSSPIALVEFPADDPERARDFWVSILGVELDDRRPGEGQGWQTHSGGAALGIHPRGPGPGDRQSLPYFAVPDLGAALARVPDAGGEVIHPGETFAVCRDSEGNPFGLTSASARADNS
jgi:predicted enzyme related to lactoylglutathione lyase